MQRTPSGLTPNLCERSDMAEVNSPHLSCRDCGTAIFRRRAAGRAPERCEPCQTSRRKTKAREKWTLMRRGYTPPTEYTCIECNLTLPRPNARGIMPERCPGCLRVRARWHSNSGYSRNRMIPASEKYAMYGRFSACIACGAEVANKRFGPLALRCRPCDLANRRLEHTPVPLPPPIACIDCGQLVPSVVHSHGRKRCNPCGKKYTLRRQYELDAQTPGRRRRWQRSSRHRRRVRLQQRPFEKFHNEEIFDRDRWVCGICKTRISRKLVWPHPRSVSLDHIIPVSQGGPHTRANCRAAHLICNTIRNNKGGGEQLALIG